MIPVYVISAVEPLGHVPEPCGWPHERRYEWALSHPIIASIGDPQEPPAFDRLEHLTMIAGSGPSSRWTDALGINPSDAPKLARLRGFVPAAGEPGMCSSGPETASRAA